MKKSILSILLLTLTHQTQSMNLPLGGHPWKDTPYTVKLSDEDELTFTEAKKRCDEEIHCAGVSKFYDDGNVDIFMHSFLPKQPITTYKSTKSFTLHKGAIRGGTVLTKKKGMTVNQAKEFCEDHPKCVAFFYPIYSYSMNLATPDIISFYSTLKELAYNLGDVWYTLISNDIDKAKNVNANALKFVHEMIPFPYSSCCDRTETPKVSDIKKVDTLERIPCNVTREYFIEHYEMKRKPVMLVGCDENWKAIQRWTFENLITRFDNSSSWTVDFGRGEQQERARWEDVVKAMVHKEHFYIFNQADLPHQKVIEEDYDIPTPIQGNNIYEGLKEFPNEEYGSLRWWAVSSGNSGTVAHLDPTSTDAWNSLISGYKWWAIYPESVKREDMAECKINECENRHPTPSNYHASIAVNMARMPYADDGEVIHTLQRPGETIYVPYGLVHSVYNIGETIAVTANYGSVGNLCRVWGELVTSGNPQHWQHVYYTVLNKRQREIVRSSFFWPPETLEDYGMEDDIVYGPLTEDGEEDEDMDELYHDCPKFNY